MGKLSVISVKLAALTLLHLLFQLRDRSIVGDQVVLVFANQSTNSKSSQEQLH